MIPGESRKPLEPQPASRNRFGARELIRLVMERCGAHRRDPEGARLRPIQVRDSALFGIGRAGVQRLCFVPPALLRGGLRLRCESFAVLVVFDPGHDDVFLRRCRQPLRPATAIRRALKPTTPASAGRLLLPAASLPQLGVETLPDDVLRPTIHPGHLQTQAVLEIIRRGARRRDVVIRPGSGLRPPHGDESIGQLDRRERTGGGPGLRRIRLVRPCATCSRVGRLPFDDRLRQPPAPVQSGAGDVGPGRRARLPRTSRRSAWSARYGVAPCPG